MQRVLFAVLFVCLGSGCLTSSNDFRNIEAEHVRSRVNLLILAYLRNGSGAGDDGRYNLSDAEVAEALRVKDFIRDQGLLEPVALEAAAKKFAGLVSVPLPGSQQIDQNVDEMVLGLEPRGDDPGSDDTAAHRANLRRSMNEFYGALESDLGGFTDAELEQGRLNLAASLYMQTEMESVLASAPNLDAGIVQENLDAVHRVRIAMIDEQERRRAGL